MTTSCVIPWSGFFFFFQLNCFCGTNFAILWLLIVSHYLSIQILSFEAQKLAQIPASLGSPPHECELMGISQYNAECDGGGT